MEKNSKCLLFFLALLLSAPVVSGQHLKLNFGLREPQPESTLPKSRAQRQYSTPVPKEQVQTTPVRVSDYEFLLNNGWELATERQVVESGQSIFSERLDTKGWYNATVPGTVLTTLVDQEVFPDPYWGINNLHIPDSLCRMEWWYRLSFAAPLREDKERSTLLFEGINYRAEIWLNRNYLGRIDGAFIRGKFDVTKYLKSDQENILAVKIIPPPNPGIGQEASFTAGHGPNGGQLCLDGPTFISSEGWDWVPTIRDRNIGIWQDVKLLYSKEVVLGDIQVMTDLPLPDTTYVDLTVKVEMKNHSEKVKETIIEGNMGRLSFAVPVNLAPGEFKKVVLTPADVKELRYNAPKLWWPNGYGAQNLYTMEVKVKCDGDISDSKKIRFGVREFDYELTVDCPQQKSVRIDFNPQAAYAGGLPVIDNLGLREVGPMVSIPMIPGGLDQEGILRLDDSATAPFMVLKVNGEPIVCKGGNWGMDDGMKRVSRERLEPYFKLQKAQNFNMIRNWTGESTEELFYTLCDEYGLLVFNDFWMSTVGYNLMPNDFALYMKNATDVVKRFRNHPSLAVWCPRNEGFAPESLEKQLSMLIAAEDGTRHYLPGSIKMNTAKSGPWTYLPPWEYFDTIACGFNTEVGAPSLPTSESIRKMMAPEDTWPIGDVWCYHDWHMGLWGNSPFILNYQNAIDEIFGPSDNLDDFCKKAQLINYDSYRSIFEAWNSKLWEDCSGVLLWMSHPAWPSMVWQTYSWDYETPGAYFGSKNGCRPLNIQLNPLNNNVDVVNASREEYSKLTATAIIYDISGKILKEEQTVVSVAPHKKTTPFRLSFEELQPEVVLVKLVLDDRKKKRTIESYYWKNTYGTNRKRNFTAFNSLHCAELKVTSAKVKVVGGVARTLITLSNPSSHTAIGIKLNLRNSSTGKAILPALFDDGYFFMVPGQKKEISLEFDPAVLTQSLCITIDGYNLRENKVALRLNE